MTALLDNPIWNALTTVQRGFAEVCGDAARFPADVTALAGVRTPTAEAFEALAQLLPSGGVIGVFVAGDVALGPAVRALDGAELVQMIQHAPTSPAEGDVVVLGPADAADMLALAERTRPGPFGARTQELGTFLGVREDGKLIAMAGQRLRLEGLVEVSGICTDPAHLGRGLAARLTTAQCVRIHAMGALPFLHVRAVNTRAIALYERLGFVERRRIHYHVVSGL